MGIYDECEFKTTIEEWDDDDGDIIALVCEHCPNRDVCSEKEYEDDPGVSEGLK